MQPRKTSVIYVFFGLIASGKSLLAGEFARRYDFPYLNTDRIRKELAGIPHEHRNPDQFNRGIYTKEFTRKTYQALLDAARKEIGSGRSGVVLDGSYGSKEERARVITLADSLGAELFFILCDCSEKEIRRRLEKRALDPMAVSDGRWEIYLVQKERFQPPTELPPSSRITINTEQPVGKLIEKLATRLDLR